MACFLLNSNAPKRCLCLNYPKVFNGASVSNGIVTYGSGKCLFAGFMGARDVPGAPGARNSSAMGPEQECPPGTEDWLVSLWGFPEVFCTCVNHRQERQKAKVTGGCPGPEQTSSGGDSTGACNYNQVQSQPRLYPEERLPFPSHLPAWIWEKAKTIPAEGHLPRCPCSGVPCHP